MTEYKTCRERNLKRVLLISEESVRDFDLKPRYRVKIVVNSTSLMVVKE
jgi:hypothetical protein